MNKIKKIIIENNKFNFNDKDFKFSEYKLEDILAKIKKYVEGEYCVIGNNQNQYFSEIVKINEKEFDIVKILKEKYNLKITSMFENEKLSDKEIISRFEQSLWKISYFGIGKKIEEKSIETLLTVGNGYFSMRGSLLETSSKSNGYKATYSAGVYNKVKTVINDRDIYNEDFVNLGNIFDFTLFIDNMEVLDYQKDAKIMRELNLKTSTLKTTMYINILGSITKIESEKTVSANNITTGLLKYKIQPINHEKKIILKHVYDTDIENLGVDRYKDLTSKHLKLISLDYRDKIYSKYITGESKIKIEFEIDFKSIEKDVEEKINQEKFFIEKTFQMNSQKDRVYQFEGIVNLKTSNLKTSCLMDSNKINFNSEVELSQNKWKEIWDDSDIIVKGDLLSQTLCRVNTYHLIGSLSNLNTDMDISMTARGLHGEAYRGHIFWDEIFIQPFYIKMYPSVVKQMLMYRYNRLENAKINAENYGYKGAMYPWQSGRIGDEQTQIIHLNPRSGIWGDDYSSLQRHVSLAIAYNIIKYVEYTKDFEFLKNYGHEMIIEIVKFWISKSTYDEKTNKYSINNVMGPDEFHEKYPDSKDGGLNDNAYTNISVSWVFDTVVNIENYFGLKENYLDKKLNSKEINIARDISEKINLNVSEQIIEQYTGYFKLKELDFEKYRKKHGNIYRIDRILKEEGKSCDEYKVAKQADTLMIFYLFDNQELKKIFKRIKYLDITKEVIEKNLNYYLKRTSHGSTLSRIVHARLAKKVNNHDLNETLFKEALGSDYIDIQGGTTAEGIHTGVMAASINEIYTTYAGVDFNKKEMNINPWLPESWEELKFKVLFRNKKYKVFISEKESYFEEEEM